MIKSSDHVGPWVLAALALATACLVVGGAVSTPAFFQADSKGWPGLIGATVIVLVYAALFALAAGRQFGSVTFSLAAPLGLAAGGIFAAEIALEYLATPPDNSLWGVIEFGAVFVLYFATGFVTAWRTRRFVPAVAAAIWAALIAVIIWYAFALAFFEIFRGGARQIAVLRAEGDFDDFARSGMRNFDLFIMQDFLGAGFFHLLLSPLFGLLLGSAGAGSAIGAGWVGGSRRETRNISAKP